FLAQGLISLDSRQIFGSQTNDIELAVLVGFESHSGIGDVAIFEVYFGIAAPVIGVGDEVCNRVGFEVGENEGTITNMVGCYSPPGVRIGGHNLFLDRVGYPEGENGVDVGSRVDGSNLEHE